VLQRRRPGSLLFSLAFSPKETILCQCVDTPKRLAILRALELLSDLAKAGQARQQEGEKIGLTKHGN
jgi:hypothetical protein